MKINQLCNPAHLNLAYARIRAQTRLSAFDPWAVADYEHHLELNLADLAHRLCDGVYDLLSARGFDATQSPFTRTMAMIEDRIVQQAVFDVLAPLFEPAFLECSFGSRKNSDASLAVRQVLKHRAQGDHYIISAGIPGGAYDRDHLLALIRTQTDDQRLLHLIRTWLHGNQILPWPAQKIPQPFTPSEEGALLPINVMMLQWLDKLGNDRWPQMNGWEDESNSRDFPDELRNALKRLGLDAARITLETSLLALASNPRYRHFFSKRNLALAAGAALAAAAYPAASHLLRGTSSAEFPDPVAVTSDQGSVLPDSPLAGLLTDIALHRFDVAITGSGLRLVRRHNQFAITTASEAEARYALGLAVTELRRMNIRLDLQQTRVERFEDGVEFLGYRIRTSENAADWIEPDESASFTHWRRQISDVVRQAPAQIGGFAHHRLHAGIRQIKSLISPGRNGQRCSHPSRK